MEQADLHQNFHIYNKYLIVPIHPEMDDYNVDEFQKTILNKIYQKNIKAVFFDLSALQIIDSFFGEQILATIKMIKLLGIDSVTFGIKPEVASALIMFDFSFSNEMTAVNLETAIIVIETRDNANNRSKRK